MSQQPAALEERAVECSSCKTNKPEADVTVKSYNRLGQPTKFVCKECMKVKKAMCALTKLGEPIQFETPEERAAFFAGAAGQVKSVATLQDYIKSSSSNTKTQSRTERESLKVPHYTKAELEKMPRFAGEDGDAALEYLFANNNPRVCKQTNQQLWPLGDLVLESNTEATEQQRQQEETCGERKAAKAPKEPKMKAEPREGAPKPKPLPKGLLNQLNKALEEIDERRHRTAVALDAAHIPEMRPYVLQHVVDNLKKIDQGLAEYRSAIEKARDAEVPDKEHATKVLKDSTETRKEQLFAVQKLEGLWRWRTVLLSDALVCAN